MPRGTHHHETGWLNERDAHLLLRRDGGGTWRLDVGSFARWRSRGLIGKRVEVTGIRSGFDVLDVATITSLKTK